MTRRFVALGIASMESNPWQVHAMEHRHVSTVCYNGDAALQHITTGEG